MGSSLIAPRFFLPSARIGGRSFLQGITHFFPNQVPLSRCLPEVRASLTFANAAVISAWDVKLGHELQLCPFRQKRQEERYERCGAKMRKHIPVQRLRYRRLRHTCASETIASWKCGASFRRVCRSFSAPDSESLHFRLAPEEESTQHKERQGIPFLRAASKQGQKPTTP